jgi:hypothetical protein
MKRTMTIDEAVRWAYREELPKCRELPNHGPATFGNGSRGQNAMSEWWTLPDNVFGVVVDFTAEVGPDDDAVRIHAAVQQLGRYQVDTPVDADAIRGWAGMDLKGLEAACAAEVFMLMDRLDLPRLVRNVAILGLPDMEIDPVALRFVTHGNGEVRWFRKVVNVVDGQPIEVEVDGFDRKGRRPYLGAYRKPYLDPDPVPSLIGRAKAEVWRSAMDVLHAELAGTLDRVVVSPCELPMMPWEAETNTVIPDLRHRIAGRRATSRRSAG